MSPDDKPKSKPNQKTPNQRKRAKPKPYITPEPEIIIENGITIKKYPPAYAWGVKSGWAW